MKSCYNCEPSNWERVFAPGAHSKLEKLLDLPAGGSPPEHNYDCLKKQAEGIDIMLTTWGALPITGEVLDQCPDLKLIIHGAGTVKPFVTQDVVDRGILVSSAVEVNGRPVAEFCLGVILSALKDVFRYPLKFRKDYHSDVWTKKRETFTMGYYQSKIGLIGFGKITRVLLELLKPFDLDVYVSSGYFSPEDEVRYGARRADTDWIFENCDVVSLHSADVPRNYNIVNAERLATMKEGSYILNTSRGRMVDERALFEALSTRDLVAILDVSYPEPPEPDNPLLKLENCLFTPHVSGSIGREVARLGNFVADEAERFLAGQELKGLVDTSSLDSIA